MMTERERTKREPTERRRSERRPPLPAWKKVLLGISIVVMVAGLALMGVAAFTGPDPTPPPPPAGTGTPSPLVRSLDTGELPGAEPGAETPPAGQGLDAWSPTIFRLGFSFFAGFCLGYVLRTFMKISILAIGLLLLLLFGLQYAGVIDVDWSKIGGLYERLAGWLQKETASFTRFVQGYLPSSASALAGLAIGFKKK